MSEKQILFEVSDHTDTRLDVFLAEKIDTISRSKISRLIKDGCVTLNGARAKPGTSLKARDKIVVTLPEPEPAEIEPEDVPFQVLWEDDYYIAVNKPPGIIVHPGAGHRKGTLVSGLINYTEKLSEVGGELRPGLVHRLDRNTSGVLMVAKTDEAHWKLSRQFARRQVYKAYQALVWGTLSQTEGSIDEPLGRSARDRKKFVVRPDGRRALTRYRVLLQFEALALVRLILETGRTHQARVHMSHIGHPVVGDEVYGNQNRFLGSLNRIGRNRIREVLRRVERQMLHAHVLEFRHPFSGEMLRITAPLPADFQNCLDLLLKEAR